MRKELSLYIHIPFCPSKCNYCTFVSEVAGPSRIEKYLECLTKEIRLRGREYNPKYEIKTIYIGGGTPSILPQGAMKRLLHEVYTNFTVRNNVEITIEINPNTLTEEKVLEYLSSGVNRFSVGLQCSQAKLLREIGRTHSFDQFVECIDILKTNGANNISVDLMIGLPNQSKNEIKETLYELIKLEVPHISTYMLSVEPNTKMDELIQSGKLQLPSEKTVAQMYKTVVDVLRANDYMRYEVSNFSKTGYRSKHNMVYWERREYLGLGVAAHSYIGENRFSNIEEINEYITYLDMGKIPLETFDELTEDDKKEEFIMLSLRLSDGIDCDAYERQFGENLLAKKKDTIKDLIINGFLVLDADNRLKATDNGFIVLNRIIMMLLD